MCHMRLYSMNMPLACVYRADRRSHLDTMPELLQADGGGKGGGGEWEDPPDLCDDLLYCI